MIGEVIKSIKTGLNPRKNFKLNTVDANNFYVTVREIQDGKIIFSEKTDKVNDDALILINNRSTLEVGDVLFSGTGTVGRMAVIDQTPKNWNIKEGVYVLKPKIEFILSKYLFHILSQQQIVDNYKRKIVGSPVISLPMSELKKIKIPIPPLTEQARIVAILDKFDALTHSITEGLPREIELRQKQYEYYRNLLLSFPKPENKL
jgi:specificity subunit